MRSIDVAILALYLAAMIGMGLWVGRKNKTPDKFMKAGGAVPGWAVGLSIFGTYVSSISFLALPGKAYASDWGAFVFSLSIPVAAWVAVRWFVPFYRSRGGISAYEHLESRFGPWARTYPVLCYMLTQIGRMAAIMYLLALALKPITGWSLPLLICLTGFIAVIYSLIGGMEAVIWTDVVQSVVFIVGAVACVVVLALGLPGGAGEFIHVVAAGHKFSLGGFAPDFRRATFWVVLLNGLFLNLQNFGIDQSYVQRYATARNDREAARSVWLGALLYLPISGVFLLIGTLLFVYYRARPGGLPRGMAGDDVFPHFIATGLPVGLGGLVIAAIFAAAQSTIASSINCSATLVLCDIYRRYFRPEAGERESMTVLRVATVGFGLAGMIAGLAMIGVDSALDTWWAISSVCSGGMFGLFLLGLTARASNTAAMTATTLGLLAIAWMTVSIKWPGAFGSWASPVHSFMIVVVGTLAIWLSGILISRAIRLKPAA